MDNQLKYALIADDDFAPRAIAQRLLQQLGYKVKTAEDGQKALDVLNSESDISLLVTDYGMPSKNGCELATEVRQHPEYNGLPVVMCSADAGDEKVQEKAESSGVNVLLEKPYDISTLKDIINMVEQGYLGGDQFMFYK